MTDPRASAHPLLDDVVAAVRAHEPDVDPVDDAWAAATALVLATTDDGGSADVLFIERVHRPGDRWSGQMALPGGKRDPEDPDLATTARRETREEVGVDLPPAIGRLDDLRSPGRGGRVATFVHLVEGRPATVPEPAEVADIVWIPLAHLFDRTNAVRHFHRALGPFAGIRHEHRTVWGLTLGTLQNLAIVIGHDLPRPRGPLLG
jgi:8-oxo-dGTP pyrophosphatase MutT (NUDIX family)